MPKSCFPVTIQTGGSDSDDGLSFANAFATTQKAADTAVDGDFVRLCQTATESISTKIDMDRAKGTQDLGIDFISYNSTGTEESIGYTIQASASIDSILEYNGDIDFTKWVGVIFDANSNATRCVYNAVADGADYNSFIDCVFKNASQDCWSIRSNSWFALRCEWTGAGRYGIHHSSSNLGRS